MDKKFYRIIHSVFIKKIIGSHTNCSLIQFVKATDMYNNEMSKVKARVLKIINNGSLRCVRIVSLMMMIHHIVQYIHI